MSEPDRPTADVIYMRSVALDPPRPGQRVLAVGRGGVFAQEVWGKHSAAFFVAWMKYPRLPADVKAQLMEQYR